MSVIRWISRSTFVNAKHVACVELFDWNTMCNESVGRVDITIFLNGGQKIGRILDSLADAERLLKHLSSDENNLLDEQYFKAKYS